MVLVCFFGSWPDFWGHFDELCIFRMADFCAIFWMFLFLVFSCHKNVFYCLTLEFCGSITRFIDSGGAAGGGAVCSEIWV